MNRLEQLEKLEQLKVAGSTSFARLTRKLHSQQKNLKDVVGDRKQQQEAINNTLTTFNKREWRRGTSNWRSFKAVLRREMEGR